MLITFRLQNFKSFKDETELNFEASRDDALPDIVRQTKSDSLNLLPVAAVFGPNASGKSNLLKALLVMNALVQTSTKENSLLQTQIWPFLFDEKSAREPTVFEVTYLDEGVRTIYGFALSDKKIHEEWLYAYPTRKRRLLFERTAGEDPATPKFKFGPSWQGEKQRLARMTRPDSLFVSVAAQFNHPIAQRVVSWFKNKIRTVSSTPDAEQEGLFTLRMAHSDRAAKERILKLLRDADFSIDDFEDDPEILDSNMLHKTLRADGTESQVALPLSEESEGTQKYFALTGPLLHVLEHGCVLVADELDSQLHPLLTEAIIRLFQSKESNPNGAQLLFAAHDASILSTTDLLRRDQVWLTDRDKLGASKLYSIWDYRGRKGENLMKGYLAGRYGAVPFVELKYSVG